MINAVEAIRKKGILCGVITNNWNSYHSDKLGLLEKNFDFFIESWKVKHRKPEKEIYQMAEKKIEEILREKICPSSIIFLDDLGINLKAANELGWNTIKVNNKTTSLLQLQNILNFPLFVDEDKKLMKIISKI
eukprot:TRINITY_DN845_c0_g1_i2.p1 TRINITY_DN845_c0_g1~~TRINITY_DN845_c0_g1_i2.p1  ORF type:complete len:133 (-),score=38.74 TRINITY_DN845_c0_g1_i2:8-406(-)